MRPGIEALQAASRISAEVEGLNHSAHGLLAGTGED